VSKIFGTEATGGEQGSTSPNELPILDLVDWFDLEIDWDIPMISETESLPLLHFAAASGFTQLVSLLLLQGAKLTTREPREGRLPLVSIPSPSSSVFHLPLFDL